MRVLGVVEGKIKILVCLASAKLAFVDWLFVDFFLIFFLLKVS